MLKRDNHIENRKKFLRTAENVHRVHHRFGLDLKNTGEVSW